MIPRKRYHPLSILIDIWGYIKGAFIPALFLFVLKYNSDFFVWKYGRYVFIAITILAFLAFILKWLTYQYKVTANAFHLYSGYIDKEEQIVPYDKIQNINRKTSVIHRLFHMTSLQFETAMTEESATITFQALSEREAKKIETIIESAVHDTPADEPIASNETADVAEHTDITDERTIHFTPSKQDTIRAFFSSFSFLVLIPILFSIYVKADDNFNIEEEADGVISVLFSTWWLAVIVIIMAIILSMVIGIVRIYLKYGKYEISSDKHRIYIVQGVLNETSFSIAKQNVQAINIEQSLVKRLLGMVEIKLISAGSTDDDDNLDVSALYPFLKKERAYAMLKEILPQYQITDNMTRLTPAALWLGLLKGSPFYLIPAAVLTYFKPAVWGVTGAWWMIILVLFFLINTGIVLSYLNSAYTINKSFIQIKKGGLGSELFLSKRDKVMEIKISRSFLQKKAGVASFEISNRSHPVKQTDIADVPLEAAADFHQWYKRRTSDIKLEDR